MKYVIIGGPRTGKTTLGTKLAEAAGLPLKSTDDLRHMDWDDVTPIVVQWLVDPEPCVVEGVRAVHALRIIQDHDLVKFRIVLLLHPQVELTGKQMAMADGILTIYRRIRERLRVSGAEIWARHHAIAHINKLAKREIPEYE